MDKTTLFVFSKQDTKFLLKDLDIRTKVINDKEYALDDNHEIAVCSECGVDITIENLGNIAKGSKLLFCDNPACFASHLAKHKL